jgi:fructose-1,6-bisphosphatase/inositol monophosphatase family enzyme
LQAASDIVARVVPGKLHVEDKGGRNVITEVDRKISDVLRRGLLEPGEGWLSEGDVDDLARLRHDVVWVVDPLGGTREFVDGIANGAFLSASL